MQSLSVNGVEIAYRIDGDESAPWLVLSNSLATDHRMWDPQINILTQTHRILRYDTRGHGQSEATPGPYSFEHLVGDLTGLMDALDISVADILGLSLGGMTALGLALDHPDRVNRLICCNARADAPPAYADGWRERIEIARQKGMSALCDGTLARWFTDAYRFDPHHGAEIASVRGMIESTSVDGFCGCAHALIQLDYLPRLNEIKVPSLFIAGQDDAAAPPAVMEDMAARIPNHEFVILQDTAHLSNLNNPTAFNAAVSDWLATN